MAGSNAPSPGRAADVCLSGGVDAERPRAHDQGEFRTVRCARRDRQGWTVFDRWNGETVVLRGGVQTALSLGEADALAQRLNRLRRDGDRTVLQ
jgi:hypothetical protein